MARIPESKLFEIQQASDIVDVISTYLPLKRAGGNYKACCPFHEEKTPSFMVSRTKQIFKCFGCGVGGNVISFVRDYEKIPWFDAVKLLADRAGIKLEIEGDPDYEKKRALKTRLYEANEWAARVFEETLDAPEGGPAREYMRRRSFSDEIVAAYRVGCAPGASGFLLGRARRDGVDHELLVKGGLAVVGDSGRLRDKFYNRIMIPIFDLQGRVAGFGGRILGDGEPKYLNSPETPVFSKRYTLFDLKRSREAIRRLDKVGIVEGYTDCMKARQAGVDYLVATLGTALTVEHVRLLKRFTDNIVVFYDGDIAGLKAADRGFDLLGDILNFFNEDVDVRIARLPEGKDPDDLVSGPGGAAAFAEVEENALDLVDFKLMLAAEAGKLDGVAARKKAVDSILEPLAAVSSPVKVTFYLQKISERLGLPETDLRSELTALKKRRRPVRHAGARRGAERGDTFEEAESSATGDAGIPPAVLKAERGLIETMLHRDRLINVIDAGYGCDGFRVDAHRKIAAKIVELFRSDGRIDKGRVMALMEDAESVAILVELAEIAHKDDFDWGEYVDDCIVALDSYDSAKRAKEYQRKALEASHGKAQDELLMEQSRERKGRLGEDLARRLAEER